MTTPVYISASSAEWRRAKYWAHELIDTGLVTIADCWWEMGAEMFSGRDHEATPEYVAKHVAAHDAAIAGCDVFWFLAPSLYSHGACQELGFARAVRRLHGDVRIYVSGKRCDASILWRDPEHELVAHADLVSFDAIVASLRSRTGSGAT